MVEQLLKKSLEELKKENYDLNKKLAKELYKDISKSDKKCKNVY